MLTISNTQTIDQFKLKSLMLSNEQNTRSQIPSQETDNLTPEISKRSMYAEGSLDSSNKSIKKIKSVGSLISSLNNKFIRKDMRGSIKQTNTPTLERNYLDKLENSAFKLKQNFNFDKCINKALNEIIHSNLDEVNKNGFIRRNKRKFEEKNSRNYKKEKNKSEFFSYSKDKKNSTSGNNEKMDFSNEFINNFLTNKKYIKYIKRYADISRDEQVINNMTKYLKEVYNIKPPSENEFKLLETVLLQMKLNKKIVSLKGHDKNLLGTSISFRRYFNRNNSPLNASSKSDLNNLNGNSNSNIARIDNNNLKSKPIYFTFSPNKSKENLNDLCGTLPNITNKKNLIIKKCDSQIRFNKRLIKTNIKNNNMTDVVIKETFNKVFSIKDVKLEKELAKDHMQTLKKSGKFIYGESQGYYTNNRILLFSKLY